MREHLKACLAYLKLNRHVSPHTVRAYESDITQYLAWVAGEAGKKISALGPADLDMESVRSHLIDMNRAGKARASVAVVRHQFGSAATIGRRSTSAPRNGLSRISRVRAADSLSSTGSSIVELRRI